VKPGPIWCIIGTFPHRTSPCRAPR
jgi:hypothetical protein